MAMSALTDPYFFRLAQIESGGDPFAKNPNSSARGLFQFINSTGKQYGIDAPFGTPEYTAQETDAVNAFTDDNRAALRAKLGREPTPGELYLAHQQGAGGAAALLANPNAPALSVLASVYNDPDKAAAALVNNGGRPDMTAADFANQWVNKFEDPQAAQPTAGQESDLIDVQLPDGTVIEGVPANISKADLIQRLQKNGFDTSGLQGSDTTQPVAPTESAPAVAEEEETAGEMDLSGPQSSLMALPEDSLMRRLGSAARTGAQGLSFGTLDEIQAGIAALPVSALSQLTDNPLSPGEAYDKSLDLARGELKQARKDYPVQSVLSEIAGGVVTGGAGAKIAKGVAPNAMSALSRYAAANPVKAGGAIASGTGGLYGFAEGEGGTGERLENAAESALLSLPFGMGGGYIAGKFGGRAGSVADDVANVVDDTADDAARAAGIAGPAPVAAPQPGMSALAQLSPEQEARRSALTAVGIAPDQQTAGMLTRDPKIWQFEQNTRGIAGVGDDIRNRYVNANETIKTALNDLGVKTGGKATTPYEAGESVTNAVISKNKEMQAEVGKLYGKIRDEVGTEVGLRPEKLFEAISDASDNAYADNVVNSMIRRLEKFGVIEKGTGQINDAAELTVSQAEELRKFANTLRGDRQTEGIVTNIINALDDDVIDTAGTDAFKTARDAARARFSEFETKILGGIADGRLVSDDVLNRTVFGGKVKDLQALKESLSSGSDDQITRGVEAWNDLKLQTLQRVIDDSSSAGGKLSGASFTKQLNKIGKERLETVFDPEELLQLRTIEKALTYTTVEVPESVVNYSGTGAASANNALSGILKRSRLGEFLEGTGDFVANAPGGGFASLMTFGAPQAMSWMGRGLQEGAKRQSVKNVLKPNALLRLADPKAVGNISAGAGIYGAKQND